MLRCSKKAYARCPMRHLCGHIEDAVFTEDSECAKFNRSMKDDNLDTDIAPELRGKWEFFGSNGLERGCYCGTCSICGVRSKYIVNTAICPNCGAKMK